MALARGARVSVAAIAANIGSGAAVGAAAAQAISWPPRLQHALQRAVLPRMGPEVDSHGAGARLAETSIEAAQRRDERRQVAPTERRLDHQQRVPAGVGGARLPPAAAAAAAAAADSIAGRAVRRPRTAALGQGGGDGRRHLPTLLARIRGPARRPPWALRLRPQQVPHQPAVQRQHVGVGGAGGAPHLQCHVSERRILLRRRCVPLPSAQVGLRNGQERLVQRPSGGAGTAYEAAGAAAGR